jgi:LPXTG-motif cell wall-anchored protein
MYDPAVANIIAPGANVNLVSFINMVFPATDDSAGNTGAFNTALNNAQTEMAAGLTGRMAAGLPADFVATGWEKNDACVPQLANTGVDSSTSAALALGVSALTAAGLALTVVSRRRRAS